MKLSPLALALSLITLAALPACNERKERAPGQWPIAKDELRPSEPPDDPAELTYRRYCMGCHGADGRGNAGTTGADLTAADGPFATKRDDELANSVRDGKVGKLATMPPHKPVLKDPEIAAVIHYARTQFAPSTANGGGTSATDAGTPSP